MIAPAPLAKRVFRTITRVFPRCSMIAQAIAFNLFLAFFPTLLIAVGFATSPMGGRAGMFDLISDFTSLLPPGSQQIVSDFLVAGGPGAWRWALVGWTGTFLAGSQVMRLLMEGIHTIYGDPDRPSFLRRQLRALLLLILTVVPLLAAAILGVFGRPLREWVSSEVALSGAVHKIWGVVYHGAAILLAMLALILIYRWARPKEKSLAAVFPGALLATLLWWVADLAFGFYVRRMPYDVIYGGVAAVIGLLIWMELSAVIIFLGAAWNAELAELRKKGRAFA